jgi:hypothetical protein
MAFNIVRYSQQDPQWKSDKIGGGPDTIGYIGCALTSLAMYASGWGFTETPATLNKKLTARGGFIDEAIVWSAIGGIYPQIQSTGLTICNGNAPISKIDASLTAGQPMIVEVDYSPDAGLQTHWVLVYQKQGADYLILDPWPYPPDTKDVTLMTRFSHGQPLQAAIKAVAWYQCSAGGTASSGTSSGSTGSTTPSTTPLPAPVETDLYVQVMASVTAGLRLHLQASADSPANFAEMPGTQLQVIEDKTGALAKIGVNNQWLYVRDPNGNQGYVAAWYVEKVSAPAPAPAPAPSTPTPSTPTPSAPTAPVTPAPQPASSKPQRFILKVLDSVGTYGLRLRAFPSLGGSMVGIEKAGSYLTVIEPAKSAQAKIGVANQWINVRDSSGLRGYVMASYVQST